MWVVLLEAIEARGVKEPPRLRGRKAARVVVASTAIQANNTRCHAGTCLSPRGVPVEMVVERGIAARRRGESRFGVRANICVQRSAGRGLARAVSAELAGRR